LRSGKGGILVFAKSGPGRRKTKSKNGSSGKAKLEAGHTIAPAYCGKSILKRLVANVCWSTRGKKKRNGTVHLLFKNEGFELVYRCAVTEVTNVAHSAGKEMVSFSVCVQRPGGYRQRRCAVPRSGKTISRSGLCKRVKTC